jgi:BMFP domain-containing protein YqiC
LVFGIFGDSHIILILRTGVVMSLLHLSPAQTGELRTENAANDGIETPISRIKKQLHELAEILRRMEFDDTLNMLHRCEMREALHAQTSMLEARLYSIAPRKL